MILIITNGLLAYLLGTFSPEGCELRADMINETLVYKDLYETHWAYCVEVKDE